jgi:hypothetical protein
LFFGFAKIRTFFELYEKKSHCQSLIPANLYKSDCWFSCSPLRYSVAPSGLIVHGTHF